MKLAGHLMKKGFVILGMEKNRHDPKRNVFLFNKSDEINDAITQYVNERK